MLNWLPRNLASTGRRGAYQALSINPSKNFKGVTHVLTTAYCRPFVGRERPGDGADLRYQPERRLRQAHLRRTEADQQARRTRARLARHAETNRGHEGIVIGEQEAAIHLAAAEALLAHRCDVGELGGVVAQADIEGLRHRRGAPGQQKGGYKRS